MHAAFERHCAGEAALKGTAGDTPRLLEWEAAGPEIARLFTGDLEEGYAGYYGRQRNGSRTGNYGENPSTKTPARSLGFRGLPPSLLTVEGRNSKSRQTRHVPLNEEALSVLRRWREQSATGMRAFGSAGRDGVAA